MRFLGFIHSVLRKVMNLTSHECIGGVKIIAALDFSTNLTKISNLL